MSLAVIALRRRVMCRTDFDALTSRERQCVFARSRGLSLREIADLIGIEPGEAADALARAVHVLRTTIQGMSRE
jgi:DNA-directed RNA polymerase specialized sigma24 family protein